MVICKRKWGVDLDFDFDILNMDIPFRFKYINPFQYAHDFCTFGLYLYKGQQEL